MESIRTCAACRRAGAKSEMLRIAKGETFRVDPEQVLPGRGAYLCRSKTCIETAIAKKALNRAFKCNVPSEVYADLEEYIHGERKNGDAR